MSDATQNHSSPKFKSVTENAVKSIKQRQLIRYWERLRGDFLLPLWADVDKAEIAASRDDLCIVDITQHGEGPRYRIREHGEKLAEYYGSACAGRFLDEITAPGALATLTAIYAQAVDGRRPVYTVTPINDSKGRNVTFERLLLPFTESGSIVEVMLTSLEVISIDGAFEHQNVLEPSQRRAFSGFQGVIEASPRG